MHSLDHKNIEYEGKLTYGIYHDVEKHPDFNFEELRKYYEQILDPDSEYSDSESEDDEGEGSSTDLFNDSDSEGDGNVGDFDRILLDDEELDPAVDLTSEMDEHFSSDEISLDYSLAHEVCHLICI